jgi:hypothetical protein
VAGAEPEILDFTTEERAHVVDTMGVLAPRAGWLIVEPVLDHVDVPPPPGMLGGLFSGRGPAVPSCAWVPGERSRGGAEHVALGIEHGSGPKAAARLADAGLALPAGWVVLQDNARRGLVVAASTGDPHDDVLGWLLAAGNTLSTVPLRGQWRAQVYRR